MRQSNSPGDSNPSLQATSNPQDEFVQEKREWWIWWKPIKFPDPTYYWKGNKSHLRFCCEVCKFLQETYAVIWEFSSRFMVFPTHLDSLSKESFPQYFTMCQITRAEDLLGIAGGGAQRFRATDVTAQNERFLWGAGSRRLGNTVTSPGKWKWLED